MEYAAKEVDIVIAGSPGPLGDPKYYTISATCEVLDRSKSWVMTALRERRLDTVRIFDDGGKRRGTILVLNNEKFQRIATVIQKAEEVAELRKG